MGIQLDRGRFSQHAGVDLHAVVVRGMLQDIVYRRVHHAILWIGRAPRRGAISRGREGDVARRRRRPKGPKRAVSLGMPRSFLDLATAAWAGLRVTNVPDYCLDEVADHTMGLLLAAARNLMPSAAAVRRVGPIARPTRFSAAVPTRHV